MRLAEGAGAFEQPETSVQPETSERIVAAAMRLFAARGFAATTVRQIAEAAGVSPGLVIQRFGSKASLRTTCDDAVLARIDELQVHYVSSAARAAPGESVQEALLSNPEVPVLIDYLTRMLTDQTSGADHLFDAIVASAERALTGHLPGVHGRPCADPEARAVMVAAHSVVDLVMGRQIARRLGSPDDPDGTRRLRPHTIALFTGGVIDMGPATAERASATHTTGNRRKNTP